jgi:hypothetical protein
MSEQLPFEQVCHWYVVVSEEPVQSGGTAASG